MKWMVAPSYKYAEIKKVNEETHKALIEEKCDRCGGRGIIAARVENGHIVPIPVDGGICYKCNGEGKITKWVKAYTEEEMEKYLASREKVKARRAQKEEEERQEKLNKSKENQEELLAKWGYDVENPLIWLVGGGNTYDIKDELKEKGCKFNPAFGWYCSHEFDVPVGYGLVSINFYDVYTWFPLSKQFILNDKAKEVADAAKAKIEPESKSEFVGDIKERLRNLEVVLTGARAVDSLYGTSIMFTFEYETNVLVWFTSCPPDEDKAIVGHKYLLTGTVKNHKVYNNIKQTYLNRCILKEFAI